MANLSSLMLKKRSRPRFLSVLGIIGTLGLAFSLTLKVILIGLALIAAGVVYLFLRKKGFRRQLFKPEAG